MKSRNRERGRTRSKREVYIPRIAQGKAAASLGDTVLREQVARLPRESAMQNKRFLSSLSPSSCLGMYERLEHTSNCARDGGF